MTQLLSNDFSETMIAEIKSILNFNDENLSLKILEKIQEETAEFAAAKITGDKKELLGECADLCITSLTMFSYYDKVDPKDERGETVKLEPTNDSFTYFILLAGKLAKINRSRRYGEKVNARDISLEFYHTSLKIAKEQGFLEKELSEKIKEKIKKWKAYSLLPSYS